ncbi:MAG: 3-oxoacyl-[acyl-carrier protein] reductase [Actinomycetia bacterium]|nr:3-oxoacyl-[acyl-carrier protein] reductase [Actinomycetes bacterium]
MLDLGLTGKTAFVAGCGSGIGQACVRAMAEAGTRVACFDIDREATGAAVLAAEALGAVAIPLVGDARQRADVQRAVDEAADAFDGIDVLVDVIGLALWGRTVDMDEKTWDDSFDVVLRHFFHLSSVVGRRMVAQDRGGSIVAIASVSGMRSAPLHGPYGAAKAGIISLVGTLAMELAGSRIRVNSVSPGAVLTPRVAEMLRGPRLAQSAESIPLGRLADPDDIAKAVTFLSSDLGAYVTGQNLVVDGGASKQFPLSTRA